MIKIVKYYQWVLIGLFALAIACQPEDLEPETDPFKPGNVNPDEVSTYLTFLDATKINGSLPSAMDGQLKINFKDTVYLGGCESPGLDARLVIRHNGEHNITGVFVGIPNSAFYFDVPLSETEARDSIAVFYFNFDIPLDEVDYPVSYEIKILPHGPDNVPIDEFNKVVTIEECSIDLPINAEWEWDHTKLLNGDGEILQLDAPFLGSKTNNQTGGCCNLNGTSTTVANDPYCYAKFNDGTPNPLWKSIQVSTFFYWTFDHIQFFEDGTFEQTNASIQTNYRPSLSDFCTGTPAYDFVSNEFTKSGTHEFTGPDYIKITYNITNPPVYGKTIQSGKVLFTPHMFIITSSVEGLNRYSLFRKIRDHQEDPIFTKDLVRYD